MEIQSKNLFNNDSIKVTYKNVQELREELVKRNIMFPIYIDYQSTTPIEPAVLDTMIPFFQEKFGNPHSRTHKFGWEAEEAVENARNQVANLINVQSSEIVFTSGATESNNIALKGVANFYKDQKNHIITVATEHKCVINICRNLEQDGFKVTYLGVNPQGVIDLEELKDSITDQTCIVSIMYVNNETGVIQPIEEIGKICRAKGVFFHSDIAQAFGKIPIDIQKLNIDLASISSHKIYGPKGVGALYVRKKPRVRVKPIVNGGGQERGIRSGTVPTPLVVGFGKASQIAKEQLMDDYVKVRLLADQFLSEIMKRIPDVYLNGDLVNRYPGVVNLSFAYVEGESLIGAIKDLAVSSGSACTSSSLEPSYVLAAMNIDEDLAHTSIRFGFGRNMSSLELEYIIELLVEKVQVLRNMSPLWEMVQEGIDIKQVKWSEH